MPWKESHTVNERMHFVTRLEKGERMTDLCSEFGISRKTGHKIWSRYQGSGLVGLEDQSRAPKRIPHKTEPEIEKRLLEMRSQHPTWGGRKVRQYLSEHESGIGWPAPSTITDIYRRHGLLEEGRSLRPRYGRPAWSGLHVAENPNDVWCTDYKGQFRLGNSQYCYPLTTTDLLSRFLLTLESLDGTDEEEARPIYENAFREYGLPLFIRSDNGPPFASQALHGLTRLSVWWMRLGIVHERIQPGHPEQNGQHERMHRTVKAETTRPAGQHSLEQQERFDAFREEFNNERPHESLDGKAPAKLYTPSPRPFPAKLADPVYPLHDDTLLVDRSGHIRLPMSRQAFLAPALAGELVGLREMDNGLWLVTFLALDLGTYDPKLGSFKPTTS